MGIPGLTGGRSMALDAAEQAAGKERLRSLAGSMESGEQSRAELAKAAHQFEGVFLNTLMKAMRSTVPENKLFNASGPTKFYQQMHDTEIAKALATGHSGVGVADLIINQFASTLQANDAEPTGDIPADGPDARPEKLPLGPPAPESLNRYRTLAPVGNEVAERQRLRLLAGQQGQAVVDTLGKFERDIHDAADQADLDPALVLAVVMHESAGNPEAVSPKGAQGLMQLMPATAAELGVTDSKEPRQNLLGGARYLSRMLERFDGDLDLALAAYNAGPGNVEKAGKNVPDFPETRDYVQRVKGMFQKLGGGMEMANPGP